MKRFLVLTLCLLALPALAQDWTEVRSPHFIVLTDAGRDRGRAVALRFEQMRQTLGPILQKPEVRGAVPIEIIAFKATSAMQAALPRRPPRDVQAAGLFLSAADADYILLDLSAPDPYASITRDYAHAVIVASTPPLPLWYDVGMAEYFSTIDVGPKAVRLGRPPVFLAALAGRKLMPAATFLAVGRTSPEYKQGAAAYRAQCWLMISWIVADHQLAAVNEYARLVIVEHLASADALQRAFNLSPQALDAQLVRFLAARPPTSSYPLPAGFDDISTYAYADRKVLPLEAQATIADFHVHSAAYVDLGIGELENIVKQDPDNAIAHRALGYAYLQKGDFDQAGEHLSKTTQLTPHDARGQYYAATLIHRAGEVMGGGVASYEMKAHLLQALDADPAYADAWFLLGIAYEIDEKMDQAIDSVVKALKLTARNDLYRLALARMYGEAKRWDDASALLAYLKDSNDPEIARQAAEDAARGERRRNAPKRTGRFDERPRPSSYDAPKWRTKPATQPATRPNTAARTNAPADASDSDAASEAQDPDDAAAARRTAPAKPDSRPILFLKGKLTSVACRPGGTATLTVTQTQGKKKTLQLATPDYKKLVLIGADAFACDWRDVNVAVNYRQSSATTGDLISLELQ
ncbi:MAG: tetratricopeptide repeat protein [Acidobacteriota bacterium]|nr:tetratricopeptide repeat protein [Acidobacteriota bacterium]